ncbi:MAG: 50S ribosomal protein L4 [Firmicutes bacterium]|nr:50S ribosomal protein L4 [Bacillota bacterium]
MPKVPVYNMEGNQVGEIELSDEIFGTEVNEPLLHQAIVAYEANRRQGTASTKTRGEVRGGGRKPWRQKGTGRARHGSIRSPIWVGGGVVFGPKPRSYRQALPRKVRRAALKSALSAKVKAGDLIVLDQLSLPEIKTKRMAEVLKAVGASDKALVVMAQPDRNVELSARNLPGVALRPARGINAYDVLKYRTLVITKDGVAQVEEVFA